MKKLLFLAKMLFFCSSVVAQTAGALDITFNTIDDGRFGDGSGGAIGSPVLLGNGRILGIVSSYNGVAIDGVARFNPDGSLDTTFQYGGSNQVEHIAIQSSGKIIIAGDGLTQYAGVPVKHIARLNADGTVDPTFVGGSGVNIKNNVCCANIYDIEIQTDDKIIISGFFDSVHHTHKNSIARLNANGTLDAGFAGATSSIGAMGGSIFDVELQPDGKILFGGACYYYFGSNTRTHIGRLNSNGSIDGSFSIAPFTRNGTTASSIIVDIDIRSDGKILVLGDFTHCGTTPIKNLARLHSNGSLDAAFSPAGTNSSNTSTFRKVKAVAGDKVIFTIGGALRRINADGTTDTSFTLRFFNDLLRSISILPNGDFFVGGGFTASATMPKNYWVKFSPDADTIRAFNRTTGANQPVRTVTEQSDGKLLIGGYFTNYNDTFINCIARIHPDGVIDTSFKTIGLGYAPNYSTAMGWNSVNSINVQHDSNIVLCGAFNLFNGFSVGNIVRLKPDGSIDSTFTTGSGANSTINTSLLRPDGKIIVAGSLTSYNGTNISRIARIHPDGTLDNSFTPPTINSSISSIYLQQDGKILIGGQFTAIGAAGYNHLARLLPNGSLDTGFQIGTGADGYIYAITELSGGKIAIGGSFDSYNNTSSHSLAFLNYDGTISDSFSTGFDGTIHRLETDAVGRLMISGSFTSALGTSQNGLTRVNQFGYLDSTFNAGVGSQGISEIAFLRNGKIIVAGSFREYDEYPKNNIARLLGDTLSFSSSVDTNAICSHAGFSVISHFADSLAPNNSYVVELSDPLGSFSSPTVLATQPSTQQTDTIYVDLHPHVLSGTQYRIRVKTTSPSFTSKDNGYNIHIAPRQIDTVNISSCGYFVSTTDTFFTSGIYIDTLSTIYGCDSILVMNLTIHPKDTTYLTKSSCDSYTWPSNNMTYTTSGIYYDTLSTLHGCDSLLVLNLTIYPGAAITVNPQASVSVCEGRNIELSTQAVHAIGYSWYKGATLLSNGGHINGVQASTLRLMGVTSGDNGNYRVIAHSGNPACPDDTSSLSLITISNLNSSLATNQATDTIEPFNGIQTVFTDAGCNPILAITDHTNNDSLGKVTVQVMVDATAQNINGQPYLPRHYKITSANNGIATLVLYVTQAEMNAYNAAAANYPLMPINSSDANKQNVRVTKFDDSSFSAPSSLIVPDSVIWNASYGRWDITLTVNSFGNFYIHTGSFPLSIKLAKLDAENYGDMNKIVWRTLSEELGENMVLQRSDDGKVFANIYDESAKGTPSLYTYWDMYIPDHIHFYRLKLSNHSGRSRFSNIVSVKPNKSKRFDVQIYPNPLTEDDRELTIEIQGTLGSNALITIFDQYGKRVEEIKVLFNKMTIDLSRIATGIHYIHYQDDLRMEMYKFLKQ